MAHINLYLCNPHQASASYPFSSIDASVNADPDADAQYGQDLTELVCISWPRTERIWNDSWKLCSLLKYHIKCSKEGD